MYVHNTYTNTDKIMPNVAEWILDLLELESQLVVNHYVGPGNQACNTLEQLPVPHLSMKPSLEPFSFEFCLGYHVAEI